jgi:Uma2 family endonuclease
LPDHVPEGTGASKTRSSSGLSAAVLWLSVSKDRNIKAPLYAASGFLEYWLVNVPEQVVEVFRAPGPEGYAERARYAVGETIALEAFPDVRIEVTSLF